MRRFSLSLFNSSGVALAATCASSVRFAHPARYVIEDGPALVIRKAQGRVEGTNQGNVFVSRRALESSMLGEDTDANATATKYESNRTFAAAKDDTAASPSRLLRVESPEANTDDGMRKRQPAATPKMSPARASTLPNPEALSKLLEKKKKRPSLFTGDTARTTANFERIMKRGGR